MVCNVCGDSVWAEPEPQPQHTLHRARFGRNGGRLCHDLVFVFPQTMMGTALIISDFQREDALQQTRLLRRCCLLSERINAVNGGELTSQSEEGKGADSIHWLCLIHFLC